MRIAELPALLVQAAAIETFKRAGPDSDNARESALRDLIERPRRTIRAAGMHDWEDRRRERFEAVIRQRRDAPEAEKDPADEVFLVMADAWMERNVRLVGELLQKLPPEYMRAFGGCPQLVAGWEEAVRLTDVYLPPGDMGVFPFIPFRNEGVKLLGVRHPWVWSGEWNGFTLASYTTPKMGRWYECATDRDEPRSMTRMMLRQLRLDRNPRTDPDLIVALGGQFVLSMPDEFWVDALGCAEDLDPANPGPGGYAGCTAQSFDWGAAAHNPGLRPGVSAGVVYPGLAYQKWGTANISHHERPWATATFYDEGDRLHLVHPTQAERDFERDDRRNIYVCRAPIAILDGLDLNDYTGTMADIHPFILRARNNLLNVAWAIPHAARVDKTGNSYLSQPPKKA